ncbi:MAG: GIY-YIG nuclease family protein [Planctomycetota bacterium]
MGKYNKKRCPVCGSTSIPYKKFNDYCQKHMPDEKRCTRITRKGKRCRNVVWDGTNVCRTHKKEVFKVTQNRIHGYPGGRGPGYIYILDLDRDSYYKIGQTVNINGRINALRASNPWLKSVFCSPVFNASHVEKKLHNYFEKKHIEREIFCLNEDDINKAKAIVEEFAYEGKDYREG